MKKESIKNRDEAYQELQPKLGMRQETVLRLIDSYGGLTISEIAEKMVLGTNNVSGRVRELEMKCLIKEAGSRENKSTARKNTVWVLVPQEEQNELKSKKKHELAEIATHLSIDLDNVASSIARNLIKQEIKRTDEKLSHII